MDESNPLAFWLRRVLIGAGLFLAGAVLSFAYSYRPLHGDLTWKIGELERRIDERNLENQTLGDELARLRSQNATQVDPESHAKLEKELASAQKALAQAEKDLDRTDRKRKDANASASRWRKRYEDLRDQQSVAAARAAAPVRRPTPAAPDSSAAPTPSAGAGAPPDEASGPRDTPAPPTFSESQPIFPASPAPAEPGILPADATRPLPAP